MTKMGPVENALRNTLAWYNADAGRWTKMRWGVGADGYSVYDGAGAGAFFTTKGNPRKGALNKVCKACVEGGLALNSPNYATYLKAHKLLGDTVGYRQLWVWNDNKFTNLPQVKNGLQDAAVAAHMQGV